MANPDRDKWNARYRQAEEAPPLPARVLQENVHLLPAQGAALDLASGLGGNALLLARSGLQAHAWDISEEALTRLHGFAAQQGLEITTEARDVTAAPPEPGSFDVIVVSRFLERALTPALLEALRPGGLLFYQTFVRESVTAEGPRQPEFRLAPNELLELFNGLHVLVYREEGKVGDVSRGWRNEALLVAQSRRDSLESGEGDA